MAGQKYRVTTEDGTYEITVGDEQPYSSGALVMQGVKQSAPIVATGLEAFAKSPTAAKTAGTLARAGTTIGGIVHGVATGNAPEVIMSPIAGWQAGKGGYWLAKGAQGAAGATADAISKASSVAGPVLGTLSGVQGGLDLAQMADPNRTDIGFLGMGKTQAPTEPPSAESLAGDLAEMKRLIAGGKSEIQALKSVASGDPQKWGRLMTLYMQSRQVK